MRKLAITLLLFITVFSVFAKTGKKIKEGPGYTTPNISNTDSYNAKAKDMVEDYYSVFPNKNYSDTPISKNTILFMAAFPWNGQSKCPNQYGIEDNKNVLPLPSNAKESSVKIIFDKNSNYKVTNKTYFDMFGNPKSWQ